MPVLVLIALVLWVLFGNPAQTIANWFWPDDAAPWEQVDAFYYPNRNDLTASIDNRNVDGLEGCRDWINSMAATQHDPTLARGDYECGVGFLRLEGGISVYRLTVR